MSTLLISRETFGDREAHYAEPWSDGGSLVDATPAEHLPLSNALTADVTAVAEIIDLPLLPTAAAWRIVGQTTWRVVAVLNARVDRGEAVMWIRARSGFGTVLASFGGSLTSVARDFFFVAPADIVASAVSIEVGAISQPSPATIASIGRVWVGPAEQLADVEADWRVEYVERGRVLRTDYGLAYPTPRGVVRRLVVGLDGLSAAAMFGLHPPTGAVTPGVIDSLIAIGTARPVIWIPRRIEAAMHGTLQRIPTVPPLDLVDGKAKEYGLTFEVLERR